MAIQPTNQPTQPNEFDIKPPSVNDLTGGAPRIDLDSQPVKQYEAPTKAIDPTKETIEGRLPGILESESPLMKRAAYEGQAYANKRGLLDSTIGAEASQAAMIDRAMPIAAQDAQTYAQRAGQELDVAASTAGREQTQGYQLQQQEAAANLNSQIMGLEADINERLYGVQQEYALQLEGMRNDFEIQKNLDTQMGTLYADALKSISNLLDNPDLSGAQVKSRLDVLIENMQSGLNFLAGIDVANTAGDGDPSVGADTPQTVSIEENNIEKKTELVATYRSEMNALISRLNKTSFKQTGVKASIRREINALQAKIDGLSVQ